MSQAGTLARAYFAAATLLRAAGFGFAGAASRATSSARTFTSAAIRSTGTLAA